ncbi:MAG TPA: hypothetical protein VGQ62_19420 [Chloroflexota bacterium]|jgi:hypothetical protein|nr:hypothetical protein [Chloroflexota bacterium]
MTMSPDSPSIKQTVDTILGIARLPMNEEEYSRLLRTYPLFRDQADALRIPEVRYSEPAMIYPAVEHL